jgi:hypothetical protein
MKNIKKYIGILVFIFAMTAAFAQTPPPPNNGNTSGGGGTPVGGGAPIGGGLIIMLAMGAAYGLKKLRKPIYEIVE